MSVKEKLDEMLAADIAAEAHAKSVRKQEEQRKAEVKDAKWQAEHSDILKQQAALLEEMRALDIVGIIEELVEKPIEPIETEPRQPKQLTPEDIDSLRVSFHRQLTSEKKEERERRFHELTRHRRYAVTLHKPSLSDDLVWDAGVRMTIVDQGYTTPRHGIYFESDSKKLPRVEIIFEKQEDYILRILGEEVTFEGNLPENKANRVETVEIALAKALKDPIKAERVPHPSYCNCPRCFVIG